MRVAVLVRSFPTVSETFILRQVTGLLDRGHDVGVFAMERDDTARAHPAVARYALMDRTRFVDAPPESGYWEQPVRPLHGRTWVPGAEKPLWNAARALRALPALARCALRAPRATREVLSRGEYGHQADSLSAAYRLSALAAAPGRYDVVHAHYGPVGDAFRFVRRLWAAPLVVSFHGYDLTRWPRENGPDVYRRLFRDATLITVNGDYARPRIEALGCPPSKVRVLPHGVDVERFAPRARRRSRGEPLSVLTVGRLVEKKGIEDTLRAVARLRATGQDVRYEVIGEGPLRSRLEAVVGELGLGDDVVLHGARTDEEVRESMLRADVFVLTSVTAADGDEEGTPVALLEAQACGLPILSTRHAGIPEIVADGEAGHLVAERDVVAIAERLGSLARDPDRADAMGRAGRSRVVETNSAGAGIDALEAVYREAVGS